MVVKRNQGENVSTDLQLKHRRWTGARFCTRLAPPRLVKLAIVIVAVGTSIGFRPGPAAAQSCIGDCDGNGSVGINDLILGVAIALGHATVDQCLALDANSDGSVSINELITAVNNDLSSQCDPVVRAVGACAAPGNGPGGLGPCADDTPVRAYSCEARDNACVQGASRQVLAEDHVYGGNGQWGLAIPSSEPPPGTLFSFEADVANGVVFRTLDFGVIGGMENFRLAGVAAPRVIRISPVTEASVRLIEENGLNNFSNDQIGAVFTAVDQATAGVSFSDKSPADAASLATQVAG